MQKVTQLQHLPGCCKHCMRASPDVYVDMELVDDFWGHVYYCIDCVRQMANLLGFATPEQLVMIEESHEEELDELRMMVRHGSTIDWLSRNSVDLRRFIDWLESEEVPRHNSDTRSEEPRAESGSAEPSNEQGLDRLSITFG